MGKRTKSARDQIIIDIHWWDNLVIQYIQELCWLAVPRPDQLKQPQIITLQFVDLNQNYFFFGQVMYIEETSDKSNSE